MIFNSKTILAAMVLLPLLWFETETQPSQLSLPQYTESGELKFPAKYREWVFLGSGLGMTYGPAAAMAQNRPQLFDNVYVNPEAYRAFLNSGAWPDKTTFILEIRNSESHASINKNGHFQRDVAAIEAHVKDTSAPSGIWTFYGFAPNAPSAKAIPATASCQTCHAKNGAVEGTFAQFYPDIYQAALNKGTLSPAVERLPLSASELERVAQQQSWPNLEAVLNGLVQASADANAIQAGSLNMLAYRLMQSGKPSTAVKLLLWTSTHHPASANLQDSLADALLADGQKDAALAATRRSLALVDADSTLPPEGKQSIRKAAAERIAKIDH